MWLARVCNGSREGPGLAERVAGGRSPQVRVLEFAGPACTPALKGPRSRWVPAFRPEQEWLRDFALGPLHSQGVSFPGASSPVSCLGVPSGKDISYLCPIGSSAGS